MRITKLTYFVNLLWLVNARTTPTHKNAIIKNLNVPACRNCIYYSSHRDDFDSTLNVCEKFGEKNIVTNKIKYKYVDSCREDEHLCGKEGKYFEEEKNIDIKVAKHYIAKNIYSILAVTISLSILGTNVLNK